jgi:hypothetical protein
MTDLFKIRDAQALYPAPHHANTSVTLKHRLTIITLLFLTFPLTLFLGFWLQPLYAIVAVGGVCLAAWLEIQASATNCKLQTSSEDSALINTRKVPTWSWLAVVMPAFFVAAISGAGGWGRQEYDWEKHNAVLQLLIDTPWPAGIALPHDHAPMVYYLSYYLPAALVGKCCGWTAANHAIFLTTAAGTILAALWVFSLTGRPWWAGLIFLLYSGMDIVGNHLHVPNLRGVNDPNQIEWWAHIFQYSSSLNTLFWVPGQAIGAWLTTAMALDRLEHQRLSIRTAILLLLFASVWSPFVMVGLSGVMIVGAWAYGVHWRKLSLVTLFTTALIALPFGLTGLYFSARGGLVSYAGLLVPPPPRETGIWLVDLGSSPKNIGKFLILWALFCPLEFLLVGVALYSAINPSASRRFLAGVIAMLLLIPMVHYGFFNDLAMRASLPALFLMMLFTARFLHAAGSLHNLQRVAVLLMLLLGLGTPRSQLRRHLPAIGVRVPPENTVKSLVYQQQNEWQLRMAFLPQYLGSAKTPFFEHFARRVSYQIDPPFVPPPAAHGS